MSRNEIHVDGEHIGNLYDDGDIYSGGKRVGHVYEDGDIYSYGRKVGSVGSDGRIWGSEGDSGYRIYDDGEIYDHGKRIGSIWGYERDSGQQVPKTGESSSNQKTKSESGFADKVADAANVVGTAASSGAGCEGYLVAFVVVGLILAVVVNWAAHYAETIVIALLIALVVFVAYKHIKKKGEAGGSSNVGQGGIGAKWNAVKAKRAAQREQRAQQKAQVKAAQEAARRQAAYQRYQQPAQGQPYQQAPQYQQYAQWHARQTSSRTTQAPIFVCPSCGQRLSAPGAQGMIRITCPMCGAVTVYDCKRDAQPNN